MDTFNPLLRTVMKNTTNLTVPTYTYHHTRVESLWIATFLSIFLWTASLLAYFLYTTIRLSLPTALERARQGRGVVGAAATRVEDAAERLFGDGGADGAVRGDGAAVVPVTGADEEVVATGDGELLVRDVDEREGWFESLNRASQAARTTTLLLLTLATLASIPIEYHCVVDDRHAPYCTTCLTNAATVPVTSLAWTFFAVGLTWFLLELLRPSQNVSTAATHRLLMTLFGQPLVAVALGLAIVRWNKLKTNECKI
ncbi:hypothetical protein HK097_003891 [Rhizophlyctis rosea]|uniref:Uncharacterized protein n=1 Tax=Rhizophlyctis rosea TaxID=64517 RepID=A0AAD5S3J2_9FUNG|nr:hypothetical protein HK097_003891 [Rhizophlyctis rosea]